MLAAPCRARADTRLQLLHGAMKRVWMYSVCRRRYHESAAYELLGTVCPWASIGITRLSVLQLLRRV